MKGKLIITIILGMIILSCFSSPTFAAFPPDPYRLNRLELVMTGLDSIMRRLDAVLTLPPDPFRLKRPAEEGVMGRLEAIAIQLKVKNEILMDAMMGVQDPLPEDIAMALMDIRESAMTIVELTRMGFNPPFDGAGVHDALMEVQMGAEMIIHTVDSFMPK